MNVKVNISAAANQFNTKPVVPSASKAMSGTHLNAGETTTEVAQGGAASFAERLANAFRTEKDDLIRGLEELSDSDKAELAAKSYLQMQGRIHSLKTMEEENIKKFGELGGEKLYYNILKNEAKENGGEAKIKDDFHSHYLFGDKEPGDTVSMDEIDEALEDVQGRIDNLVYPYGKNEDGTGISNRANEGMMNDYLMYASMFEAVTGLKGEALESGDDLLLHKLDRTEENYVQKANETIKSLEQRSKDLRDMWEEFKGGQEIEIGGGKLSEEALAKMQAFEYLREQFVYGNDAGSLKSLGLLDANA